MMDFSLAIERTARAKRDKLYAEFPMKGVIELFAFRRLSEKQKNNSVRSA